jgi:CDP-diglyceride synthetase
LACEGSGQASRILALVVVPLLLLVILKGPAWLFLALTLAFALAGFWELSRLASKVGWKLFAVGYPLVAFSVTAFYPGFPGLQDTAIGIVLVVGLAAVFTRDPGRETSAVVATVFAILYTGPSRTVVGLRMMPRGARAASIVFLLAVMMVGTRAPTSSVGRSGGAPRPVLSPKKTVEGSGAASFPWRQRFSALRGAPQLALATAVGLGLSMALLGVVGDLRVPLEALRRDQGHLLSPAGHGGCSIDRQPAVRRPFLFCT